MIGNGDIDPRSVWPLNTEPLRDSSLEELERLSEDAENIGAGEAVTDEWAKPESLATELPPVPAFDLQLLPDVLRPLVRDVSERMQTPPDFAAVIIVLALAGVTNRRALIQPKARDASWVVIPNLWGCIIAAPGLLKSPLIRTITRSLTKIDALWRADFESRVANYSLEKEELEIRMTAWKQKTTQELKKKDGVLPVRPDDSLKEPELKRLITQDATAEKLHEILRENPAGVLIIRDELSGWFESLERQGREGERAFFLSAWNGDTGHTIDRIGRGSIYVPACCVSILGAIPPARLRAYLEDVLNDGPANDGLLQRFQLSVWPDISEKFEYIDRPEDEYARALVSNIFTSVSKMDSDDPARFKFTAEAQSLFEQWLNQLERRLRGDELPTVMQAHLAKFRSLMPSLALLFALADGESEFVDLRHAQLAVGWCSYLEAHAVRIYSAKISPQQSSAITLSHKLTAGWKQEEGRFSLRDVYKSAWAGLTEPDECRAALRILEEAFWVRRETKGKTPGRPSETYLINPELPRQIKVCPKAKQYTQNTQKHGGD